MNRPDEGDDLVGPAEPTPRPRRGGAGRPMRRMILRNTAALPALATLLNGIAGFASIHYATKGGLGNAEVWHLSLAAWLIFVAMAFDALDGRLARMARQATDFGGQLDSLCDAISFGVAPALLMVHAVALTRQIEDFEIFLPRASALGKLVMAIAVIYACCAVLRLARFNIENAPDVLHHLAFKGLPSPAAAAVVAAMVLLFDHLQSPGPTGWLRSARWFNITVGAALPAMTLAAGLLMISRFTYPHLLNRFVAGRKSFSYIVVSLVLLVVALMFRQYALTLGAIAYAASGPVAAAVRKFRRRGRQPCGA